MTLQPSKEDFFRSYRGGHRKHFYHEKTPYDSGSSSYWSPGQNEINLNYNSNPLEPQHESFMKSSPLDPYGNIRITLIVDMGYFSIGVKCFGLTSIAILYIL